jgi:hypothetical protein
MYPLHEFFDFLARLKKSYNVTLAVTLFYSKALPEDFILDVTWGVCSIIDNTYFGENAYSLMLSDGLMLFRWIVLGSGVFGIWWGFKDLFRLAC